MWEYNEAKSCEYLRAFVGIHSVSAMLNNTGSPAWLWPVIGIAVGIGVALAVVALAVLVWMWRRRQRREQRDRVHHRSTATGNNGERKDWTRSSSEQNKRNGRIAREKDRNGLKKKKKGKDLGRKRREPLGEDAIRMRWGSFFLYPYLWLVKNANYSIVPFVSPDAPTKVLKMQCRACAKGHENIFLFTRDKNSLSAILPVPILTHCHLLWLSVCNYNIFSQQNSFYLSVKLGEETANVFWKHYDCRPLKKTSDIGSDTDVTQSSMEDISRTICDHRSPDQKHFTINHKQAPLSKIDTSGCRRFFHVDTVQVPFIHSSLDRLL